MSHLKQMVDMIDGMEEETIAFLREIIEMESPTTDREAVNRVASYVRGKVEALGALTEIVPSGQEDRGDHLVARFPGEDSDLAPILCIAHLDTVWKHGTLQEMPFRIKENKIYGPGIYDMKGATVCLLTALKVLQELGHKTRRPVVCLFNSDEEINSTTSRVIIDKLARESYCVLILEGGVGEAVLTSRKGIMYFKVTAKGKSTHAGMDHDKGINAIEEIAHQIIRIQQMTNYEIGTTVSCGIIQGGTRTNVIPGEAVLEIDARVPTRTEVQRLKEEIEAIQPILKGAELDVYTLVKRPPLDRNDGVVMLYKEAKQLALEFGYDLTETSTGGISDGNLTAKVAPTLDGLGPIGDGAHAVHEHIERDKLTKRIALIARLLENL